MSVSASIVTRGDVDLAPIIGQDWPDSVDEIVVYDNSVDPDLSVYGRYAAIEKAKNPLIFVQDDDVVLPRESIERIIEKHVSLWEGRIADPNEVVVCNMPARFRDQPQYERGDQGLVGFGACFHRDAPARAFAHLGLGPDVSPFPEDEWWNYRSERKGVVIEMPDSGFFRRTCDIVFTALTPRVLVDVLYENLPWAEAENRMWKQPEHVSERMRMLGLVRKVRDEG